MNVSSRARRTIRLRHEARSPEWANGAWRERRGREGSSIRSCSPSRLRIGAPRWWAVLGRREGFRCGLVPGCQSRWGLSVRRGGFPSLHGRVLDDGKAKSNGGYGDGGRAYGASHLPGAEGGGAAVQGLGRGWLAGGSGVGPAPLPALRAGNARAWRTTRRNGCHATGGTGWTGRFGGSLITPGVLGSLVPVGNAVRRTKGLTCPRLRTCWEARSRVVVRAAPPRDHPASGSGGPAPVGVRDARDPAPHHGEGRRSRPPLEPDAAIRQLLKTTSPLASG